MGFLSKMFGEAEPPSADMLRLGSNGLDGLPDDVRAAAIHQRSVDVARNYVINGRIHDVLQTGNVAAYGVALLSKNIEQAALLMPEERQRVDGLGDIVSGTVTRLVTELGQ